MSKKKIIFYLANFYVGGAERTTITIMKQLEQSIFDIYLVVVKKEGVLLEDVPKNVTIIDLKKEKTLFSIISLRKILKDIEPDIVYSTLFRTHIALDIALTSMSFKCKKIYFSPTSPKLLFQRKEMNFFMKKLTNRAYKNADSILAQTPEMKVEIAKYHNVNSDKITFFLNPIDTEMIDNDIENSVTPFNKKKINVVGAGRLSDVKGFDVLIKSFSKVLKVNENFHLNIVGKDAGERKSLEELTKELSIDDNVTFWGYQDNVFKFFFHSNLFVLSSRREGIGNVVLENMYIKKPVIVTKCVAFFDILIENGKTGFLVDVEDSTAMAEAILNYKQINVENYTYMDRLVDVTETFLEIIEK